MLFVGGNNRGQPRFFGFRLVGRNDEVVVSVLFILYLDCTGLDVITANGS